MATEPRFNPRGDVIAMIHRATTANDPGPQAEEITAECRTMPASSATSCIVGHSLAISTLRLQIWDLTSFDAVGNPYVPTLLLQGETGTGKGLVARVIHDSGPRIHGPFLEVNCAAIPEALLEAELFGFEAGAFTDAKRAKPGLFEAASGGTLFLDEVDALPLLLQSKLLNAIESKRIRRVGAVTERSVDVKLIAATPTDIGRHVGERTFRADLYHRLAVVMLTLPPLRERGEDCLILAQHFLRRYTEVHGIRPKRLSRAAETWLLSHDWPGNVRELSHLMERVTLLSPETIIGSQTLERHCLPRPGPAPQMQAAPSGGYVGPLDEPARIARTLLHAEGNVMRAARLLGISRGALRYRMRQYGIERPRRQDPGRPSSILPQDTILPVAPLPLRRWRRIASLPDSEDTAGHLPASQAQPRLTPCWEQTPVALLAISLTFAAGEGLEITPDDPWTVVAHWEQSIVRQLTGCGGMVLQRSPSMLIAAFGVHEALEQLLPRTVQAALAIRHAVAEMRRAAVTKVEVEVRTAVHTGMALVDVQTPTSTARVLPMADALTLTLRLLGDAAPGEILLSPQVRHLVKGWSELQTQEVLLEDRPLDRTSTYTVVGLTL